MGDVPPWFSVIKAARWVGVPPWELLTRPRVWMEWALAAEAAEATAQRQANETAVKQRRGKQ
jgi:hypothetical protein